MTTTISSAAVISAIFVLTAAVSSVHSLGGSAPTLTVSYGSVPTVCGVVAQQQTKRILCWQNNSVINVLPEISFDSIAGGRNSFCGVRSGGYSLICWNHNFVAKRLYFNLTVLLQNLTVGDTQICALTNGTGYLRCWRDEGWSGQLPDGSAQFLEISSGFGFSCGISMNSSRVICWGGNNALSSFIQNEFSNLSMSSIVVGGNHACGFSSNGGLLICRGTNASGELNVPNSNLVNEYSSVALGMNHGCAIRVMNNFVVCWGGAGEFSDNVTDGISFESIVAGLNFTCGLKSSNLTVLCWGPGWGNSSSRFVNDLSLPVILPGSCVQTKCECGTYPQYQVLCSGNGNICRRCSITNSSPQNSPPTIVGAAPSTPTEKISKGLLAFAIVGSVGMLLAISMMFYCWWIGVCGQKKIHNSVQPTIAGSNPNAQHSNSSLPSRSSTIRREGSRGWGRQRSGPSGVFGRQRSGTSGIFSRQRSGTSGKHAERMEEFLFSELAEATNSFSFENKIGAGSFGIVYKGKLADGRDVAIKRGETGTILKKFQEKENAFDSELAFLSRLHHKHLVRLVGYCEERDERLLVYDYMKNGALHDHLHDKNNVAKESSLLNSWKMRIKISLDAARGIEYLHNYAVPPIIHRDIKSSNILLDANWTARVSDFGLSLKGSESDRDYRPKKAVGTVGYIDPEYYGLNVLTPKSDVYGLGVVLLELLTGKRAIFKSDENEGNPISLVDYIKPVIVAGKLMTILDTRVGQPELNEAEAVELVAYTAIHCVNLEGKDRPTITDVVANLERALVLCENSNGSISSGGSISLVYE